MGGSLDRAQDEGRYAEKTRATKWVGVAAKASHAKLGAVQPEAERENPRRHMPPGILSFSFDYRLVFVDGLILDTASVH